MKVLVSNPCLHPNSVYPPYLWARFKTYIDLDYENEVNVEWLPPLYMNDVELPSEDFDILVISNYVWNYEKNYELARQAKERNPNIFVIAGGPQTEYKNPNIWDHSIDAFCYTEGERVFAEFLYAWDNDLSLDIPGIVLKTNPNKQQVAVPKLQLNSLSSVYLHCKDFLQEQVDFIKSLGKRVNIVWETNRGCPYGCTFCDWGSATNSKIKLFNFDLLLKEIDLIMSWKPEFIFIADANWGMYDHDTILIEELVKAKYKYDSTTDVVFSAAKNKKTNVNKSFKLLTDAGMNKGGNQIGFQHLDPEVLKNIKRDNIKTSESIKELKETVKEGIPIIGVLILGNPGDTVDKWKNSIFELLKMQFHEDIKMHDFMLLPNAPAADPAYIEKYKIGTVEKYYNEKPGNRSLYKTKFVVESYSYDKYDWIEMQIWSYFIQAAHSLGLYKFASLYSYHYKNIDYQTFYETVIEIPVVQKVLDEVRVVLQDYVFGEKQNKFISYNDTITTIDNYIYMRLVKEGNYLDDLNIDSEVKQFQEIISINLSNKKSIKLSYDFPKWFNGAIHTAPFEKYNESLNKKQTTVCKDELYNEISLLDRLDKAPNYRHQIGYYAGVLNEN